jgi:bifunctional DNA-binding transcriptional regulator/antitoxin component of YhaV-PrlF toxin-antitoxin module
MAKKYVRKLQRVGGYSYALILPKALVKEFGWKERQKLEIVFGGRKHDVVVRDWKPKAASKKA